MPENELGGFPFFVGKDFVIFFGAVVGVDDDALDADAEEVVEGVGDHGTALDGEERFGAMFGERAEACAQSGS